jgi:hypothetical protein
MQQADWATVARALALAGLVRRGLALTGLALRVWILKALGREA